MKDVPIAPNAVCKTREGILIHIGDYSSMEDEIILHAIDAFIDGVNVDNKRFSQEGDRLIGNDTRFDKGYAIYISGNVSLAHDSLVHGPVWIGNNTLIGVKSTVLDSKIGNNVDIRLDSTIIRFEIPDNTFVLVGSIIRYQTQIS